MIYCSPGGRIPQGSTQAHRHKAIVDANTGKLFSIVSNHATRGIHALCNTPVIWPAAASQARYRAKPSIILVIYDFCVIWGG